MPGQYQNTDPHGEDRLPMVKVVLTFMVSHTDECNGDLDQYVNHVGSYAKSDPKGWLMSLKVDEHLPTEVAVYGDDKKVY